MFKKDKYLWNYLFNQVFNWYSAVNYPDLLECLNNNSDNEEDVYRRLGLRFSHFLASENNYHQLLYLACVESVGLDNRCPQGLFADFDNWISHYRPLFHRSDYVLRGPKFYYADKNVLSWNGIVRPQDYQLYLQEHKEQIVDTSLLDKTIAALKKDYPELVRQNDDFSCSLRNLLLESSIIWRKAREEQREKKVCLEIIDTEKLRLEKAAFLKRKDFFR